MTYNRRAGKSTREMAKKRHNSAIWIGLVGLGVMVIIALVLQNSTLLGLGGVGTLLLLFIFGLLPNIIEGKVDSKLKEEKRAIRGANGEEKTGELLEELSADYYVLNDVESPYGNIDHIVIGKDRGIFLIETKAHWGKVITEGDHLLVNEKLPEKDFISQVLRNTYWLRDEINQLIGSNPWITPIIVFTNAFVVPSRPIKGVSIINKKYLSTFIQRVYRPNLVNTKIWEQREAIESSLRDN